MKMAGAAERHPRVNLGLKWGHGCTYDAMVTVAVTDSCCVAG
jgi:hypothetical protein